MLLQRTTLRIEKGLKRAAERRALEKNTTLQSIFNTALAEYLEKDAKRAAHRMIFYTHDLGKPLDNLRRGDYYKMP